MNTNTQTRCAIQALTFERAVKVWEQLPLSHQLELLECDDAMDANTYLRRRVLASDVGYTLVRGDEVLGMGGVLRMGNGVGVLWMVPTPACRRLPKSMMRAARAVIEALIDTECYWRLEARVWKSDLPAVRFAMHAGLTEPPVLLRGIEENGRRRDQLLFARVGR